MRVLLVEDDDRVADALVPALTRRGLTVRRLAEGAGSLELAPTVDVVLLDLNLPDVDGFALCRRIRSACDVAIIVVSAYGEVDHRIAGLQAGADDYLVKPYDVDELVARIQAVRRRQGAAPMTGVITLADVTVDLDRHEVVVAGAPVSLTRKEFQVFALLVAGNGAVVVREHILDEVWGHRGAAEQRTLHVHVATLRTKLGRPRLIKTVHGVGYRIDGLPGEAGDREG